MKQIVKKSIMTMSFWDDFVVQEKGLIIQIFRRKIEGFTNTLFYTWIVQFEDLSDTLSIDNVHNYNK